MTADKGTYRQLPQNQPHGVEVPATRAHVERRRAEGCTTKEIRRILKRYLARQLYRALNAFDSPPPLTT